MPDSNGNGNSMLGKPKTRVLITGGAGFFGSHLSEALLQRNHEVLVLDGLSTGSIENMRDLKARHGCSTGSIQ